MWCRNFRRAVVTAGIAVAHVVDQNDHHIGQPCRFAAGSVAGRDRRRRQQGNQKSECRREDETVTRHDESVGGKEAEISRFSSPAHGR